jgi:energy-coupling factor transport system permease protein
VSTSYQYLPGTSLLHRADPITKMIWLLVVSVEAFVLSSPIFLAAQIVLIVIVGLWLGRNPFGHYVRGASILLVLMLGIFFFQVLFQHGGKELFRIGPLPINATGINYGLTVGLRIALISIAALLFIWTTRPRDLVIALVHIGLPYRFGFAILIGFQFVPLLEQQAKVIREAHAVRGLADTNGRIEAWRRYMFPMLAFGIRKAEAAAIAMECRALGAYPTRTFVEEFRWSRSGLIFLAVFVAIEVALAAYAISIAGALTHASNGIL